MKSIMAYPKNKDNLQNLELSVVVPVYNEKDNIESLIDEIRTALENIIHYEIIYVDDNSRDGSKEKLIKLKAKIRELRVLSHQKQYGQSAAIVSGIRLASAPLIVTLDGDGQNNPADITNLLKIYKQQSRNFSRVMVCGNRINRKDNFTRRISSKIANIIRSNLLKDLTLDTGCGLKLFPRKDFLRLPTFDHMHRFLPALMIRSGVNVLTVDVSHRSRTKGKSKYGILDRLWVGIFDLIGVTWLVRRTMNPIVDEIE